MRSFTSSIIITTVITNTVTRIDESQLMNLFCRAYGPTIWSREREWACDVLLLRSELNS